MPFAILRKAAELRSCRMPIVTNKLVEAADTPAKKDDYMTVKGLRLVIDAWKYNSVENIFLEVCRRVGETVLL